MSKGEELLKSRFRVIVPIQVRFRDLDAMGHVNNAVYLTYLEMGRVAYYRALMGKASPKDFNFILAHAEIDFRSPIHLNEDILLGVSIVRVGNKSFQFAYEIREATTGRLIAEARSVQAMYDYSQQKTIPIPEEFRQRIEEFEGKTL